MTNPRLFEDLTELAGGAASMLTSLRQQLREETKERLESMTTRMDLVTRSDFERLEGMITKARHLQDDLIARLTALELAIGIEKKTTKTTSPKKPTAKISPKKSASIPSRTKKATAKPVKKAAKRK